jgi:AcrR family transcriptional regulator
MPATPTRKRSPRLSRETRISSILAAAREVFEELGYEKAKIADIAARLDVVEGTVFHYFPSKRLLVTGVIEAFYQTITEEVKAGLCGIEGTRNRLHYVIHFHLKTVTRDSRLCGVILRESRGLDLDLSSDIHQFNRDYTRVLVDVIKEGIAAGDISADTSIPMVRDTVYGSIEHTLWNLLTDGTAIDVDEQAQKLTRLVYNGISAPAAPDADEVSALVRQLNRLLDD